MRRRRADGPAAPVRLRRAAAFAGSTAVLAAIAHATAGGSLPDAWLLLLGMAVLCVAVLPLMGREATWPVIATGLGVAQAALHLWLERAGGHAGHGSTDPAAGGRMVAAHVVATAAAVIWLRYLEQRVWAAARRAWVALLLHRNRWLPAPTAAAAPRLGPAPRAPAARPPRYTPAALGRRGPPVAPVL